MNFKYLNFFLFSLTFAFVPLHSVDFVLFTQPKTAKHFLLPILTELTGKNGYCPREYLKNASKEQNKYGFKNPDSIFFEEGCPCRKSSLDIVWQINQTQGSFLHFHAPYSLAMEKYLTEKNTINFFVKRDPRDQIVSLLNHFKHISFYDKKVESINSDDERLLFMIKNILRSQTLIFKGWIHSPRCCVLDFAKLMGSNGGAATDIEAIRELKKIPTALKLDVSDEALKELHEKYFGSGESFFRGKIGAWKEYFKKEHKSAAKREIGDLLIELGYEKDYNW